MGVFPIACSKRELGRIVAEGAIDEALHHGPDGADQLDICRERHIEVGDVPEVLLELRRDGVLADGCTVRQSGRRDAGGRSLLSMVENVLASEQHVEGSP